MELWGVPQIAESIGRTVARVHQLIEADPDFPVPELEFGTKKIRRLYRATEIRRWARQHGYEIKEPIK